MSENCLIECARVYINIEENVFLFKCWHCRMDFPKWCQLEEHLLKCHDEPHHYDSIQNEYTEFEDTSAEQMYEDGESEFEENSETEMQIEVMQNYPKKKFKSTDIKDDEPYSPPAQLQQTELVLIAGESDYDDDFEIENDCWPTDGKVTPKECDSSDDNSLGKLFHVKESSRVFYNLAKTQKHIILDFIDIIRDHPCFWDPNHGDYNIRDKRIESSEQISVDLKERWNINISEQTARASVLHLCRWFEREYIRSSMDENVMSPYPDYYGKLYEFLPRDHLKVMPCDLCGKQFKTENQLRSHKYNFHNGAVPYKCRYCSQTFLFKSALHHHENRHTKAHYYQCKLCDYECPTKSDLQVHTISHSNVRAYVCSVCGASYKSSTSLNVHRRSHEPPRIKCELCGKMFRENYRLKRHMFVHAARKERTSGVKMFQCRLCEKYFSRSTTLDKHVQKWHGLNEDDQEDD